MLATGKWNYWLISSTLGRIITQGLNLSTIHGKLKCPFKFGTAIASNCLWSYSLKAVFDSVGFAMLEQLKIWRIYAPCLLSVSSAGVCPHWWCHYTMMMNAIGVKSTLSKHGGWTLETKMMELGWREIVSWCGWCLNYVGACWICQDIGKNVTEKRIDNKLCGLFRDINEMIIFSMHYYIWIWQLPVAHKHFP